VVMLSVFMLSVVVPPKGRAVNASNGRHFV
jgi:hypothetical protein